MSYGIIDGNGNVLTTGTTIYSTPANKGAYILNINFNNPTNVPYTIELYKKIGTSTLLLYKLELNAGDHVNDTNTYNLNQNTELYAVSDSDDTVYSITGNLLALNYLP